MVEVSGMKKWRIMHVELQEMLDKTEKRQVRRIHESQQEAPHEDEIWANGREFKKKRTRS